MTDEITWRSATDLARAVRAGELSPDEVATAAVDRVEQVNPGLNAIVAFDREQVLRDARELTAAVSRGDELGPLHGVPFTIKDLTAVAGLPTTFGMVPLKDNIADTDAVVVRRLREAGGLFLGKTNTPESGYYGGTDNHLFGPTHNPWKRGHTAGGSSGGAAAAVAAGLGPLAEGSDGAGSVRIPAALCGVVGLKPTTGVIPQTILAGRYYTWAYHGPITRTVADNALMLDVLAGPDTADPLTIERPERSYTEAVRGDIRGLRVAFSPDLGLGCHVDPEVLAVCREVLPVLEHLGATVTEATPGWGAVSEAMWHGIWVPGFASEHDLLDWESLHGEVDENLIELMREGERLTGVDVGRAEVTRGAMWDTWTRFMDDYDVLVSPTLCSASFELERFAPEWLDGTSLREQLLDWLLTYPYNMLNNPAVTLPAGFTADGRPVGLQVAARHRQDALVLRVAGCVEQARPWADRRPSL
ncbi:amidase [Pseudonocardia parietis]|uniref:Aspartyl-tRNA(Asn)/glutamyl-tRNA(Gln) amidotransferase subunit A n=1 Tax=Pseudonocardia parietis TaxID=570936 RepID=A0ABS4VW13_9PSEU|nr:amidase family protein [Pseudonocardia parietis]MBP2368106.1 aspartyl-tRNA(Asn)/glutamyl-tRNA(Gln) amidotransferase subunit A [Pseudonocardia parietis]